MISQSVLQIGPRPDSDPVWLRESDRALCLHRIIESWVVRTPEAAAVWFEGASLTYGELDAQAAALAARLGRHGVGVGALVGVSMKRSLEMIVAVYGILKAGAAYVPLDPRLPRERLLFMVGDAPLAVVLTRGNALDLGAVPVLDLLQPAPPIAPFEAPADIRPGDLAYAIYTSGSTGQPKGAMVPHRGVVNWLVWMRNTFQVTPADTVLKKAPLTFDVSAWELFLPLISGARLVLADSDRQFDPRYLTQLCADTRVTIAQFVPSLMRSFLELPDMPDMSSLRHVMCGGEVLPPKLLALFFEKLTSEVCNSYGPTECSIGVTRHPCRRDEPGPSVPIGTAIDNTELYILDPDCNPVPPGTPGELYIGGISLGRGYLNRPDLTAERFIPNPFNQDGEARMYRTGDLCRFLDDGDIDFLGRIDDQVKVRGVRIELGEVETALASHPEVAACAAAAEEVDGEKRLAAFVLPAPDAAPTDLSLRSYLREKLPQAMVPAAFYLVEEFPLSANGKIDRKKLAAIEPRTLLTQAEEPGQAAWAPADDLERRVAALWRQALGHAPRSAEDDFFDSGGDSLTATELLVTIETAFGTRIPLDKVLDSFTLGTFIGLLRQALDPASAPAAPGVFMLDLTAGQAPTAVPLDVPLGVPLGVPLASPRPRAGNVQCRIATMADVPGIRDVCARAFPAYANATVEQFRALCAHRWQDNPALTPDVPLGWVLETAAGEIVGFHGLVPVRLWAGGQVRAAVSPTSWAADPGHGRAGLTMLADYMAWGAGRFLLNTTANATTSRMHQRSDFGMQPIPIEDFDKRLVWFLDMPALVRWKLAQTETIPPLLRRIVGFGPINALAGLAGRLALGLAGGGFGAAFSRGIHFGGPALAVEPVTAFGAEFDALWDRLKGHYDVTMERSARFLNWRHIGIPALLGRSHVLACRDGGELLGYIVLREPATTAAGHMLVADLFTDPARPETLHSLLNAGYALARSRGASAFEVFGVHPSVIGALATQSPYILRRQQLERLGRGASLRTAIAALRPGEQEQVSTTYWYKAPDPELARVCATGAWWPSAIDGDLNL